MNPAEQIQAIECRLRRQQLVITALIAYLVVHGAGLIKPASAYDDTVRARHFVLIDADGRTKGEFGLDRSGDPTVLLNSSNQCSIELGFSTRQNAKNSGLSRFFGLQVKQKEASARLGLLQPDEHAPASSPPGLQIDGANHQKISLALDSIYQRPYLLMGDPHHSLIDMGVWFVDQRPYLKFLTGGTPRASLFVPPNDDAKLELLKPEEKPSPW